MKRRIDGWLATVILLAAFAYTGCSQPVVAWRVAGHDPAEAQTVLVLPVMDARTLVDTRDPLRDKATEATRMLLVDELRETPTFARKTILAPTLSRPSGSYSLADMLALGKRFRADLVVDAQLFSFTATRAASIPPRAGFFLRIASASSDSIVFAGEDYCSAGRPGASGGRELQARLALRSILNHYADSDESDSEHGGRASPKHGDVRRVKAYREDAPRVLVLPMHERPNAANLIDETGGGAVITTLLALELGRTGKVEVLQAADDTGHDRLLSVEESLALGRDVGADVVVRGQVVEFRRAKSVPSLWSAAISTAILAAQVLFAEMSGVDYAVEAWRVEDGACVFSRRDVSRQKYVVRAEVTVRKLMARSVPALRKSVLSSDASAKPIIDGIVLKGELYQQARAVEKAIDQDTSVLDPTGDGKVEPATAVSDEAESEPKAEAEVEVEVESDADVEGVVVLEKNVEIDDEVADDAAAPADAAKNETIDADGDADAKEDGDIPDGTDKEPAKAEASPATKEGKAPVVVTAIEGKATDEAAQKETPVTDEPAPAKED